MTGILDLPPELIVNIISLLDNKDVFNTRLGNKYIESSSLPYFGKRFFRKKGYLVTTPSLNVLKSIVNHDELRKYVQHVWFNPDCYTFIEPECAPDEEMNDDGEVIERTDELFEEDRVKYEAFTECIMDHGKLLSTPKLAEDLTDVFSKLPNLVAIGMRRSEDHSPWGWTKLKETIGEDPRVIGRIPAGPKYFLQAPTKLFVAIMYAVAEANVELKRLYTDVVEIDNILPEDLPQDLLNRACRSLLYLEFNAARAWLNQSPTGSYNTARDESDWGEGLLRLVNAVPHLLELGLQIFRDNPQQERYSRTGPRDGHLTTYPYIAFEKLVRAGPALSHLTRLKLEKLPLTPNTLRGFLEPSAHCLTSLKLRDIRLIPATNTEEPWYSIFTFLHSSCPKLSYLLLYHLMYDKGGISFNAPSNAPAHPTTQDGAVTSYRREEKFVNYENIILEAKGREDVSEKLAGLVEKHSYQPPIFSYAMDETMWHTDTSDEEW